LRRKNNAATYKYIQNNILAFKNKTQKAHEEITARDDEN